MNFDEMTLSELNKLRNQLGIEILSRIWFIPASIIIICIIWILIIQFKKRG